MLCISNCWLVVSDADGAERGSSGAGGCSAPTEYGSERDADTGSHPGYPK